MGSATWARFFHAYALEKDTNTSLPFSWRSGYDAGLLSQSEWVRAPVCIYLIPPHRQDVTQGQFFNCSLTGLNSKFSFSYTCCLTKTKELSLSYYLPLARGRIIRFIPFSLVQDLNLCRRVHFLWRKPLHHENLQEFEVQLTYYVHFRTYTGGKGLNLFIFLAMSWIVPLLL